MGGFDYSKYPITTANDNDLVDLGPYQLESDAVYEGQWKNGLRYGKGKQI